MNAKRVLIVGGGGVSGLAAANRLGDAGIAQQLFETFAAVVRDEDYAVASLAQRSANAGLQDSFLFGRNEPTLHHYHNTYRKVLGQPPLEPV